jgi:hypothetical protein
MADISGSTCYKLSPPEYGDEPIDGQPARGLIAVRLSRKAIGGVSLQDNELQPTENQLRLLLELIECSACPSSSLGLAVVV